MTDKTTRTTTKSIFLKMSTDKVQTTIIEASGSRIFTPPEKLASMASHDIRPMAGDSITPNNYIPLEDANTFFCPTRITLGSFDQDSKCAVKETVLPTKVSLSVAVTTDHVLYELKVSFCNRLKDTAAAILDVPRMPGVILMEEAHEVGNIEFEPKVMAKEKADSVYKDAENSSDKTATLSSTDEDTHHIKLDKIPAGASGVFGLTFIQSDGLRCRDMVLSDASEEPSHLADIAICPGYTGLDASEGVPFDFNLIIDNGIDVDLPMDDVIMEDTKQVGNISPDMKSLILLGGSLVQRSLLGGSLQWKSICGLALGTLLKVRLEYPAQSVSNSEIGDILSKTDEVDLREEAMNNMMMNVDSIKKCFYSSTDGSPLDTSLVDVNIPLDIPGTAPSAEQHEVYIIVDTSGSTGMSVRDHDDIGCKTFLDASKLLLNGILEVLPKHIEALRKKKKINQCPIKVRLWQFNTRTTEEAEITLGESSPLSLSILQARVKNFISTGCTNYDGWAHELRSNVSCNPSHLHSVLLVTDGGATSRAYFFRAIDSIMSQPGIGFFQVDCLGYGPWLDPSCVSHLAQVTGGEAIMVESLHGEEVRIKVLGMMARSILRAASRVSLEINSASVLATRLLNNDNGKQPPRVSLDGIKSSFTVSILPGQHVRLLLLHSSGETPIITIGSNTVSVTSEVCNLSDGDDEWVDIGEMPLGAVSRSILSKLSNKRVLRAMRHLLMLEPAYFPAGSVYHPIETASERYSATLHTSILGQIVSPSATKGCAVAQLELDIEPVPEHCRPIPSSLGSAFASHRSKRELHLIPFAERSFCASPVPGIQESRSVDLSLIKCSSFSIGLEEEAPIAAAGVPSTRFEQLFRSAGMKVASVGGRAGLSRPAASLQTASRCSSKKKKNISPALSLRRRSSKTGAYPGGRSEPVKQDGSPSLSSWLRMSSGGLYPCNEAMEFGKINILEMNVLMGLASSAAQKVEAALRSEFGGSFRTDIEDEKNSPLSLIDSISVEHEDLFKLQKEKIDAHVQYLMLKIIECAIFLYPMDTGTSVSFQQWSEENRDKMVPVTCGFLVASDLIGVENTPIYTLLVNQGFAISNKWPWMQ